MPLFNEAPVPNQESQRSCCVIRDIDFASFYYFDIWFLNCSDSVVPFCFSFLLLLLVHYNNIRN